MQKVLEVLAYLYWPLLPQVLAESLWHADWKDAYQRGGISNLCKEALRTLVGTNSYPFFVPMNAGWSGWSIQQLLAQKGIRMWGWAFANGTFFFHVRRSQAVWAQYIMLREGVPLQGPLLAREPNASNAPGATAKRQTQRPTGPPNDLIIDFEQQFDGLIQKISSFLNL